MKERVFQGATEDNAVRVVEQDGDQVQTLPYTFPLPAWEGVEKEYHAQDFALCEALHFMGAAWGNGYSIPNNN